MIIKDYVVGFAIEDNYGSERVILIRKIKPEWQKGLLNGVGGKIEDFDKTPAHAMVREFKEEVGLDSELTDWNHFLTMDIDQSNDPDPNVTKAKIYIFYTTKFNHETSKVQSLTEEQVSWYYIGNGSSFFKNAVVPNVYWLLPMVLDKINNPNTFKFAMIKY